MRRASPSGFSEMRIAAATSRRRARCGHQSRPHSPAFRCDRTYRGKGSIVPRKASRSLSLRRACSASTVSATRSAGTAPSAMLVSSPPTGSHTAPSSRWSGPPPSGRSCCIRADARTSPRIGSSLGCCGHSEAGLTGYPMIMLCANATDLQSCKVHRREVQQPGRTARIARWTGSLTHGRRRVHRATRDRLMGRSPWDRQPGPVRIAPAPRRRRGHRRDCQRT